MLMSYDEYPDEYKFLKNNPNGKGFIFVDDNATSEEKENLKKYDKNCLKYYGYHLIQNYEDLDK